MRDREVLESYAEDYQSSVLRGSVDLDAFKRHLVLAQTALKTIISEMKLIQEVGCCQWLESPDQVESTIDCVDDTLHIFDMILDSSENWITEDEYEDILQQIDSDLDHRDDVRSMR